jgi:hypothetical protein
MLVGADADMIDPDDFGHFLEAVDVFVEAREEVPDADRAAGLGDRPRMIGVICRPCSGVGPIARGPTGWSQPTTIGTIGPDSAEASPRKPPGGLGRFSIHARQPALPAVVKGIASVSAGCLILSELISERLDRARPHRPGEFRYHLLC